MHTRAMILALLVSLGTPAVAQEADEPGRLDQLFSDMLGAIDPWMRELSAMLGDLSGWHAPEVLPNGDILIRRRHEDQAPSEPSVEGSDGSLEL
ncbi:hypothetical protein [Pararhodobacter zhoushanensis]|uniref:hypothetical protein n=1 Tax=Pararhodobacter zhoushanensis TaxID=2479545 RepID=UPI000F8DE949|nr:hypothetical protein [Pararhodobacter zhoushanensis]